MLRRFAAATATASAVLAIASLVVMALPVPLARFAPLLSLWCVVPAVWGLWAMLAPRDWVPGRLPLWGALLGVLLSWYWTFLRECGAFPCRCPTAVAGSPC